MLIRLVLVALSTYIGGISFYCVICIKLLIEFLSNVNIIKMNVVIIICFFYLVIL